MSLSDEAPSSVRSRMEMLQCPCCSSGNWKSAQRVRRASLSECPNCGLLATTSFLKNHANMEELYDVTPENHEEYCDCYLGSRIAFYKRIIPKLSPFFRNGRLLEIGSGYGYFLEMASQSGWKAEGVEISKYASAIARSRGCQVHQEDLLTLSLPTESYDVVAMWDVIEHFPRPGEILRRCAELLRPGGVLILRTPNARALCPGGGLIRAAYRHLAYPANTPEHVFHFTPEDLTALVAKLGLEGIEVDSAWVWEECVITGNYAFVRAGRWVLLRYASATHWPYEFVLTATRPRPASHFFEAGLPAGAVLR
jgi:2-polyprenyl-3-methyl-5-hydroxy-6-metoxy-1,4-benzoquinol methylase